MIENLAQCVGCNGRDKGCCPGKSYFPCDRPTLRSTSIQDPNVASLAASAWEMISIHVPSVILPITVSNNPILAYPARVPSQTPTGATAPNYRPEASVAPYLPWPGDWYLYNASSSRVQYRVVATPDTASYLEYRREGIQDYTHSTATVIPVDPDPNNNLVLAANPNRKYALFVNPDLVTTAYISLDGSVPTPPSAIPLFPNGGNFTLHKGNNWRGAVWGTVSAGSISVLVTEGV